MTSYLVALAINIVLMLAATVWMIRRHANQLQRVEKYTLRPLPSKPVEDEIVTSQKSHYASSGFLAGQGRAE